MKEVKNTKASWKGVLSFGLVSIPIKVYAAVRDFVSPLHQYHADSLKPIRHVKFEGDWTEGAKPVNPLKIAKGFELEDKKIVTLSDEELECLNIESEKVIDITDFVKASEIDSRMFEKPYFLVAEKGAQKGYSLLFHALAKNGKVGIAKVAVRGREYLMAISANKKFNLLNMESLRWPHELVSPNLETAERNVSAEELKLAEMLIDAKTTSFNPEKFKDNYYAGLKALMEEKNKTGKVTKRAQMERKIAETPDMVAILNESLKKSVKVTEKKTKKVKK